MLAWRAEVEQLTSLSRYADELCLTLFEITKDMDQNRLISWTRLANATAHKPPKPELPKQRNFECITTIYDTWKGF